MTSDLIEPEGVDSTEQPPPSHPTGPPKDHSDQAPLPMDVEEPAAPGQELAEGEG
jgi:hypothetical protein